MTLGIGNGILTSLTVHKSIERLRSKIQIKVTLIFVSLGLGYTKFFDFVMSLIIVLNHYFFKNFNTSPSKGFPFNILLQYTQGKT